MSHGRAAHRRLPIGAEVQPGGGVHFRVWAPARRRVSVLTDGAVNRVTDLQDEGDGFFSRHVADASAGTRYHVRLDDDPTPYPDLASRFQPEGPHGPSQVVDPSVYTWRDAGWPGVARAGQVLYELHVGTFTQEGTFRAAAAEFAELKRVGITTVELMPVADFPGRFGWGYDGVDLFAPTRLYGEPDDLRRLVDEAHRVGLAVILDVVYNHVGPSGACFRAYSPAFFSARYKNEWGEALNFDGEGAGPVRDFFASNAAYWIDEFHVDGLRLDATQAICDASDEHLLVEVARRARAAAGGRSILLIAENEAQEAKLARPVEQGGYGLDALWNDDFHHALTVALTGHNEAYYSDYSGHPQEIVSSVKSGYLYQGQYYSWQRKRRGTPAWDLPSEAFVAYVENHDQVANSGDGLRLAQRTSPGRLRAVTALLLLAPATPLLFQGQEFGASSPFLFFADHEGALADAVRKGRRQFLAQFPSLAGAAMQAHLADPGDPGTFRRCKLDLDERLRHAAVYRLHIDLLALRHDDPVFGKAGPRAVDGAVLGDRAFALRFFAATGHGDDRVLVVNLGCDLALRRAIDPLLAPPEEARWTVAWSSEDPLYGGGGTPPVVLDEGLRCPGESAVVLRAVGR